MSTPAMSIVIPSVNGWGDLGPCLSAATQQEGVDGVEIIVADRVGETVREHIRRQYTDVVLVEADRGTTIPRLRALAFRAARGDVIGVIEDHVIVPRDWSRQMLDVHGEGAMVVGGSVENAACERLTDWAAFLCEYSHCLSPPPVGPAEWLTGNNVTYRRAVLERFWEVIDRGGWESDLHDAMKGSGVSLESRPAIRVGHKMHYTVGEYVSQRFLYSRAFAGLRLNGANWKRRLTYGAAMLALPPVLLSRIVARTWKSGRHRRELFYSLPLLAAFTLAWAAGEMIGAWFGGGDALARVR